MFLIFLYIFAFHWWGLQHSKLAIFNELLYHKIQNPVVN